MFITKAHWRYGIYTLPDPDFDSYSDWDCKPHGYIVIRKTFHIALSWIQILVPTADYRNGIGIGVGIF